VSALAVLLAVTAITAGCGGAGGAIDLADYERALGALRDEEGDGQLHGARIDGGEITFDLVREGPATRVRWSGGELEDTDGEVFAGPYFDIADLSTEGARALIEAAPVDVDSIEYTVDDRGRVQATLVGAERTFIAGVDGSDLRELRPAG